MTEATTLVPAAVRLDVWLWAARFFKTRSLAKQAVETGKVDVAGQRPKSSRAVRVGERCACSTKSLPTREARSGSKPSGTPSASRTAWRTGGRPLFTNKS